MAEPKQVKVIKGGLNIAKRLLADEKALPDVHYADPLKPATMRMSEALGNAGAEGKTLNFTEADRSRVFGSNRGGVGFSGLQHYSLPHKEANTVWGFGNETTAKKKVRQNDPEKNIWTTFVGAPTQHKSNTVVLQDAVKEFQDAVKAGKVHPAQIELMNKRIKAATDDKTGARLFDDAYDLTDPDALSAANSFARRSAIGDVLLGEGVKGEMRRKAFKQEHGGQTWHDSGKMESILKRETDPDLVDAGTFDVGNRLFVMDNGVIHRPDLNVAFPYQVTGNDLGMKFQLTPKEAAMRDWMKQYEGRVDKKGNPAPASYMDLARNNPSQFVDEDFLTFLQKMGRKKGGAVDIDAADARLSAAIEKRMAKGGAVDIEAADARLQAAIDARMADGGKVVKGAAKVFKKLFNDDVLPMTERDANLAKFLEPSKIQQRLYHGTTATEGGKGTEAIRRIKPSKEGSLGSGVYLTPRTAHASGYSGIPNDDAIAAMRNSPYSQDMADQFMADRASGTLREGQVGGNMLPVHAQIKNPLILEGTHGDPAAEALIKLGMDEDSAIRMVERAYEEKGNIGKQIQARAQAAGYDGLAQYRDGELSEVVSYNPNAVKSAIGNQGTYDTSLPDLNKADGGKIVKGGAKVFKKLFEDAPVESQAAKQMRLDMMPTARIGLPAPGIIIPGKINNVREAVRNMKGNYGARRVERAADEIPNLERMYKEDALKDAFTGDNARALMTMNPADFENYAARLHTRNVTEPKSFADKTRMSTEDYLKYLRTLPEGFDEVPYLKVHKEEAGLPLMPHIYGHEGRHRNRSLAGAGEQSNLVQFFPNYELHELPRRTQEEYIEALKEELAMTGNKVKPEKYFDNLKQENIKRPPIELPDIYAGGGLAMAGGGIPHMADAGRVVKGGAKFLNKLLSDAPQQDALRVYHGSPHRMAPTPDNPLGKFDSSKIGTGEGGAAYGIGHYLAQAKDVAKTYRPRSPRYEEKLIKEYNRAQAKSNYPKMEVLEDAMLHKSPDEILAKYSNIEDGYTPEHAKAANEYLKWLEKNKPEVGGLYHVDLPNEHISKMLDWDKPMKNHPADIKKMLDDWQWSQIEAEAAKRNMSPYDFEKEVSMTSRLPPNTGGGISGEQYYSALAEYLGGRDKASKALREMGIPGIKYYDEASRPAGGWEVGKSGKDTWMLKNHQLSSNQWKEFPTEEEAIAAYNAMPDTGTRNFVVFPGNEDIAKIVDREKKGGAIHKADGGGAFKTIQWAKGYDGGGLAVDVSEPSEGSRRGPLLTERDLANIKRNAPEVYEWAKQNVKDEASQLKTAGGMKDFALRTGAQYLGGIPDLINLGLMGIDAGLSTPRRPVNLSSEKPWFGSEQYMDAMHKAGMLGENEFPIAETLAGVLMPAGLIKKGIKKMRGPSIKEEPKKRQGGLSAMAR